MPTYTLVYFVTLVLKMQLVVGAVQLEPPEIVRIGKILMSVLRRSFHVHVVSLKSEVGHLREV